MIRQSRGVLAFGLDQLAAAQEFQGGLDSAFRKTGFLGNGPETGRDRLPFYPRGLAVEMKVNKIRGRLPIMADNVAHQDVENVVVDWDRLTESGHDGSRKEEGRIRKEKEWPLYR